MEMQGKISFTFDPRYILLSLQIGCSFVRAAVACAILERISGSEGGFATSQDLPEKDFCKIICGAPTTFQGHGIE